MNCARFGLGSRFCEGQPGGIVLANPLFPEQEKQVDGVQAI